MRKFAELYRRLDETTNTGEKTAALKEYFEEASASDAAWAVYFLSGRRPKRPVKSGDLRRWAAQEAGIALWLFDTCHDVVGDLAETITRVLPEPRAAEDRPLREWVEKQLLPLRHTPEDVQRRTVLRTWRSLGSDARFVWNRLLTSGLRAGMSQKLVIAGLSAAFGLKDTVLAHRLEGDWQPSAEFFEHLVSPDTSDTRVSHPYPFCLADSLADDPATLGTPDRWLAEWKWDGVRAQIVRRNGKVFIWTRAGELVTDRFPETRDVARLLPDGTVLDGELLAWSADGVLPIEELQRRIGRKTLGPRIMREVPVCCLVFDLLEYEGRSLRDEPLSSRRRILTRLLAGLPGGAAMCLSKAVGFDSWEELAELRKGSRERGVEGIMLKDLEAPYTAGRKTGAWWKWRVDPLTVDAVLVYAQSGGGRANLHTNYTVAVWDDEGNLVPFARAIEGLSEADVRRVDDFVLQNTLERFGPVRSVKPELVFEIAFEAIRESTRHKSGLAVRSPRIQRWREDKLPRDAAHLSTLKSLLPRT